MGDQTEIADPTNWYGGFYELAIDFGTCGNESLPRLAAALTTLWSHPTLDGCHVSNDLPASTQQRVAPTLVPIDHPRDYYGVATLPNGDRTVCRSLVSRPSEDWEEDASDWLCLLLPMAALGGTDLLIGSYPWGDVEASLSWRRPLDAWLAGIARSIAQVTEYTIAVIGMEGSVPDMVWDGIGRPDEDDVVAYLLPSGEDSTYFPSGR